MTTEIQKPQIDSMNIKFVQDGNTCGTTSKVEVLDVSFETTLPEEEPFIILKSETGWSIDTLEELQKILENAKEAYTAATGKGTK